MTMFNNSHVNIPYPTNEPQLHYAPGSVEAKKLKEAIEDLKNQKVDIPVIINGQEIRTGNTAKITMPHDHGFELGVYHKASPKEVDMAIEATQKAFNEWQEYRWEERAAIFLKAADLLAGKYRYLINAAAMLSVSKNPVQAEIDAACELIDFLRFNAYYMQQIYKDQPMHNTYGLWNFVQHRPLEGFVFAVTPFNFVSIAGNLPTAPAIMGNVVLWKPASSAVYAPYFLMKIFKEAGLPDGVINFIPGSGKDVGELVLKNPKLAGVHFTGSTAVFQNMWRTIGTNIQEYKSYPRIVGETGGKDFIFAHNSAQIQKLVIGLVRGAYEYQGQKCSAASRAYIPASIWPQVQDGLKTEISKIKTGTPEDFSNFVNAVIDKNAFNSIKAYIDYAKNSNDAEIIIGGEYDDSKGYFVQPTVIVAKDPHFKTMEEEIFGPVLTVYVYDDDKFEETLDICNNTSNYALTGAVFSLDRKATQIAFNKLEFAAGNFYLNDKCTAAVVGQQPFGGGRASGTNDKAGSYLNLIRWVSPRTMKETFDAPEAFEYPCMDK